MKIILIDNQALHLWQKLIGKVSIGMKSNKRCLVLCSRKVSFALLDKDWDANSVRILQVF